MKNKEIEELLNKFKNADSQQFNELVEDFDNVYKLLLYIEQLENNRDKAIGILGNYKHYSTPTEEQNRENEDIVDNTYNILKGDSDDK